MTGLSVATLAGGGFICVAGAYLSSHNSSYRRQVTLTRNLLRDVCNYKADCGRVC